MESEICGKAIELISQNIATNGADLTAQLINLLILVIVWIMLRNLRGLVVRVGLGNGHSAE